MAKFQYDKKQLLPAAAMGLASAGLFGYFFLKISTPPPIQAAAPPAKNATAAAVSPSAGSTSQAGTQTADSLNTDQAIALPLPSSRDPFAAAIVDNGSGAMPVRVARNIPEPNDRTPIVPGLPSPGSLGPMRPVTPPMGQSPIVVKPAGPDWVVTGVLSEPSDPRNRMAILRSSSERRFVRLGDMVDGSFRLTDVERYGVTLTDGNQHY